jgi:phosphoglycolate phosphatase
VDITNSLNYAAEPYGLDPFTVEKTVSMVGEGLTRMVEKAVGPERQAIVPKFLERFLAHYSAHLADYTVPYPGVRETLPKLTGYRKAVISNKKEVLSRQLLDVLGLSVFFECVLGSDSVEERKPSPKPLRYILELFSADPREAVMIGDSNFDIEAGRAAGVRTVAVSYGYRGKDFLQGADVIISSFEELPGAIEAGNGR